MSGENETAVDEIDAKYESLPANRALDKMDQSGSRLKIFILDACRDNPFRVRRSGSRGLAQMSTGEGTFIAYATGPGKTASDDPRASNGLFTAHLLKTLRLPDLKLDEVFNRVREDVYYASNKQQLPWTSSSVIGDFFFTGLQQGAVRVAQQSAPQAKPPVPEPQPAEPANLEFEMEYCNYKRLHC